VEQAFLKIDELNADSYDVQLEWSCQSGGFWKMFQFIK